MELAVGVYEEYLALALFGLLAGRAHDEDAGGDAGAVEEVRSEADDGFEGVGLDEPLPDLLFGAAAEEDAVGHDGRHHATTSQGGEHVLSEHEVGLLAGFG